MRLNISKGTGSRSRSPKEQDDGLDPCAPYHHIQSMNKSTISNRPRNPATLILSLALIVSLLIAAAFLWRAREESRDRLNELSVQKTRLQQELANAKQEIRNLKSGDPSPKTEDQRTAARGADESEPDIEELETFFLQAPTVRQTDKGLVVHFEFKPADDSELPEEEITLVVRIPNSSTSKILSLAPVAVPENANVRSVIHPAGYLGLIQGSPADMGSMAFEFTVPEPVKATVRGSQGILDFEFDITPEGCTVRKL